MPVGVRRLGPEQHLFVFFGWNVAVSFAVGLDAGPGGSVGRPGPAPRNRAQGRRRARAAAFEAVGIGQRGADHRPDPRPRRKERNGSGPVLRLEHLDRRRGLAGQRFIVAAVVDERHPHLDPLAQIPGDERVGGRAAPDVRLGRAVDPQPPVRVGRACQPVVVRHVGDRRGERPPHPRRARDRRLAAGRVVDEGAAHLDLVGKRVGGPSLSGGLRRICRASVRDGPPLRGSCIFGAARRSTDGDGAGTGDADPFDDHEVGRLFLENRAGRPRGRSGEGVHAPLRQARRGDQRAESVARDRRHCPR